MGSVIAKTAQVVANVVGYKGFIQFELIKPYGSYRKTMDSSQLNLLKWWSKVSLVDGWSWRTNILSTCLRNLMFVNRIINEAVS